MELHFITGSKNKVEEIKSVLGEVHQLDIELPEIQEIDAHIIIRAKLTEAKKHNSGNFIVEDTSLYLDALEGLPGPLIKWFVKTIGVKGIYTLAKAFGNFNAEAKTIIGYSSGDTVEFFEGSIRGTIVEPQGAEGFGFDPIFQPEGYQQTYAEMEPQLKGSLSMRKVAAEKLKTYLSAMR